MTVEPFLSRVYAFLIFPCASGVSYALPPDYRTFVTAVNNSCTPFDPRTFVTESNRAY